MKLLTFRSGSEEPRVGLLLDGDWILDLHLVARILNDGTSEFFGSMMNFINSGEQAKLAATRIATAFRKGGTVPFDAMRREAKVVKPTAECKIMAPVHKPGKVIHTTGNFAEHQKEVANSGFSGNLVHPWVSFLKRSDAVIGTDEGVVYPRVTKQLDYEIEVAAIIGERCKYVSRGDALNYVVGYTIFNDISARDIQMEEHSHGQVNVGKNLDTFAPMGPYLVTRDDIPDPQDLDMELRVNGEIRQKGSTKSMRVTIAELIEHYSCMTLNPGDIITTGTISGSGYFRKDRERYLLKVGDVIEAQVDKIGILRNYIIEDKGLAVAP